MNRFTNIDQYKNFFERLIQLERKSEMEFHLNEIMLLSAPQREAKGRAILNLSGKDSGTGIGGVYLVKLVRGSGLPDNEISNGDVVIISKDKPSGKEEQATVVSKTKRSITIAYNKTPPYLVYGRNLRLDLYSNDITFQRMLDAIEDLKRLPILQEYIKSNIDLFEENENTKNHSFQQQNLNSKQQEIINQALVTNDIFLIHGPPGTGKTTTLSYLIKSLFEGGKKVLVTAPSNTAVDNILEKLQNLEIPSTRIGNPIRMDENLLNLSLDVQLQDHPDYQQANGIWNAIQVLKKEQNEYIPASGQNRRGLSDNKIIQLASSKKPYRGIQSAKLRKMAKWIKIQQQINKNYEQAQALQLSAIESILEQSPVICATNSSAGSELLKDIIFDVVCIDEATQSTEPEALIPLVKGRKWVLAGDHQQLPPTVKSSEASDLSISLFERFQKELPANRSNILTIQYRMHQEIMRFSNENFYQKKLKAHPSVAKHSLADLPGFDPFPYVNPALEKVVQSSPAVVFVPCEQGVEEQLADSHSWFNKAEIALTKEITDALLSSRLFPEDIGIISPYDQQVSRLKSDLKDYHVEIKSIDGFQGREKEVIIISLVRSNLKEDIGFLRDYRRLNVALTRAKRKLIIIGSPFTLQSNPIYKSLIKKISNP
ncbi:ATPase AAA [Marivirga tractuosa]|uniref:DNA helicase n=1 Tax=Marivirga tractuosa (strain ATCC 23168 / DSM 4126 / NBRC 15989 / NCIMB 1408 / VKM B-1430 / H-43) TaxID=643867 RepID=E4TKF8_MARTH|nr:IGHMBP2 family helicase [Marivirga tractuosa]ADR20138.1 DNA helicase [Marivirga tractuosa DSM 4126]BDD15421.1 ATPase AAA [Marivirga tractuosa]